MITDVFWDALHWFGYDETNAHFDSLTYITASVIKVAFQPLHQKSSLKMKSNILIIVIMTIASVIMTLPHIFSDFYICNR